MCTVQRYLRAEVAGDIPKGEASDACLVVVWEGRGGQDWCNVVLGLCALCYAVLGRESKGCCAPCCLREYRGQGGVVGFIWKNVNSEADNGDTCWNSVVTRFHFPYQSFFKGVRL